MDIDLKMLFRFVKDLRSLLPVDFFKARAKLISVLIESLPTLLSDGGQLFGKALKRLFQVW